VKDSRVRLAVSVCARLGGDLYSHPIIGEILAQDVYDMRTRCLSAAIARVELDQRRFVWRLAEYVYVLLLLPAHERVTIGAVQCRVATLIRRVPSCTCNRKLLGPSLIHCITRRHQALTLLHEVASLLSKLQTTAESVNAYLKGMDAPDLRLPTVYSRVVSNLAGRYELYTPLIKHAV
jgi:hypothetical protein